MPRGIPGSGPRGRKPADRLGPRDAYALQDKVKAARIAQLRREILDLEQEMEAEARFGADVFEEGAVITWTQVYPGRGTAYTYAAIKAAGTWWVTGSVGNHQRTWEELVRRHLSQSDDAAYVETVVPL